MKNETRHDLFRTNCGCPTHGLQQQGKEIEELRKELADLKAKEGQREEKKKLQEEIAAVKQGTLEGAVFIVTKSRENVKLGLVTVSLFDADRARQSLRKLREETEAQAHEISVKSAPLLAVVEKRRSEYQPIVDEYGVEYYRVGKPEGISKEALKQLAHKGWLKEKELNDAIDECNLATKTQRDLISSYKNRCFAALGMPLSSTKTDADGKFKLLVPKSGDFVLAAEASREVGGDTESYSWIVAHSLGGRDQGQIF